MHTILTAYSDYSPGYSILKIPELVAEAKRLGQRAVGLTDIMSVNGLVELTQECDKADIQPIIGATLRICTDINWRKTKDGPKKPPDYYIRWYVRTEAGLKELYNLLSFANSAERFYQEPRLTIDDVLLAVKESHGGGIITTGSLLGIYNNENFLNIYETIQANINIVFEICPINTPLFDKLNNIVFSRIKPVNEVIYTYPTLYLRGQDNAQEIMLAINRNLRVQDGRHYKNVVRDFYPLSSSELYERIELMHARLEKRFNCELIKDVGNLTDYIGEYKWTKPSISLPSVVKSNESSYSTLVQKCKEGFQNKLINNKVFNYQPTYQELRDRYNPRLNKELAVIKECGFSDYFLLVADLVQWAKDNNVRVGCGRGSVGGSLVAYILNITECDPVRFDLLFERFINKERLDLPDIDLDFMSTRRSEVINYLQNRFGAARVAGITNYNTLQPAGAIRDVGKALGLEEKEYECSKVVLKKHGLSLSLDECAEGVPEIDRFRRTYLEVWQIAQQLVGRIKVFGRHAAGVVVGACDLAERCVLDTRSGEQTINWDKYLAEQQGFVKIDILGLTTLDLIDCALQYIRKRHNSVPNLNDIDLNDPEVLANFAAGKTIGVFQFESAGMRKLLTELGADGTLVFDDLVAVTALYRPGPLDSGMTDSYVLRKRGKEVVDYVVPQMQAALGKTYGVAVYQEQIMQLARDLAGFSFSEADSLRKAMGKKSFETMEAMKEKFISGAMGGYIEVELEDGSTIKAHKNQKFNVEENNNTWTLQEILINNFNLKNYN